MQSIWDAASDRDYYGEQYEDLEEHDGDGDGTEAKRNRRPNNHGDGDGTTVSTTCCRNEENDEKWNG